MGVVDDNSLKEELETCKHFLVESELLDGWQRVYNFAMDTLNTRYLLEKLDVMFNSLNCADKLNVAFDFMLKSVEDGSFSSYCALRNITLLERSKLVATSESLTNIKNPLINTGVIELRTRERVKTNWKFYKLSNVTNFAA